MHPVWHELAQHTALLGQFAAFPKAKASKAKAGKKVKLTSAFINPHIAEDLIVAIEELSPVVSDAESQVALRNIASQLSSGRQLHPADILLQLEGQGSALSVLLALASGQDPTESIERLKAVDSDLAEQLNDLHCLQQGQVLNWKKSRTAKGENSLSEARQLLAWENTPPEAAKLSSKQLAEGLELLRQHTTNAVQIEKIMWWRLNALHKEGKSKETIELLTSLKLDQNTELSSLAPLLSELSSESINTWLLEQIPILDDGALVALIQMETLPLHIRSAASKNISDDSSEAWESVFPLLMDIYTQSMELNLLAKMVT